METPAHTTAIFSNGSSIQLYPGFVRTLVRSHPFQIFMIFCILFFVFTGPYQSHASLEKWQSISIIAAMGGMVFAIYFTVFAFLIRFGQRLRIRRFHTIWLVLVTSFLASFLGEKCIAIFDGPRLSTVDTLMLWGFHFAVFAGLEVLFGIFVLPDLHPRGGQAEDRLDHLPIPGFVPGPSIRLQPAPVPPAPAPAPPVPQPVAERDDAPVIVISDRRFSARLIRSVMSQEHYISVSLFGGDAHFLRGRIRDFLGQVPEDLGYCIHRSHWVSWAGIARVDIQKDSMIVIMDDSTELPVARGRRSDFAARWNRRAQHG